jgi:hypothetical protein
MTAFLSALFLLVLLTPLVRAQPSPDSKWTSSEPHESQAFGSAVAIEGAVAAVGAPGYDPAFSTLNYGAAYVYRYDGSEWIEKQKLTKPQPQIHDQFGWSVALAFFGTETFTYTLLVGMSNDEDVEPNAGAVYVYQYDGSTWEQEAMLVASDGAEGDNFSYDLAAQSRIDGADFTVWRSLVGAPRHNLTGFNREGAAYMYRNDGGAWVEEAKLTASDAAPAAKFGESVAMSGDLALIGAPGDRADDVGQNAGAAYVFEYDGSEWVEKAKLTASDAVGQAAFGGTVALDGDRALIGARLDDELGGGAGAAYVFRFDGSQWVEKQKLTASDNSGFILFGSSVALDGNQALIGAENWFSPTGDGTGKAYLFAYDDDLELWQEQEEGFVPGDGGAGDHFGEAVALDGGVVLVGAPDHGLPVGGNGAVYVYGEPMATAADGASPVPNDFRLHQNFPNPFNPSTTITYSVRRPTGVHLTIFNVLGQEVRTLVNAMQPAGEYSITWDGRDEAGATVSSGPYLYRMRVDNVVQTRSMMFLK